VAIVIKGGTRVAHRWNMSGTIVILGWHKGIIQVEYEWHNSDLRVAQG
jgi:hypothetical protein